MGTLMDTIRFIEHCRGTTDAVETKLDAVQRVFNRNFTNVRTVRTSEIEFLQDEFFSRSGEFPEQIRSIYKQKLAEEKGKFIRNYNELSRRQAELEQKRNSLDAQRREHIEKLTSSNTSLDAKEEKLKKRIAELDGEITEYNGKIKELSGGFGFLVNLGKMKTMEKHKKAILEKRDELIAEIEDVRERWQEKEREIGGEDSKTRDEWNNLQTDYALLTEKLETLRENRNDIVKKAAFSSALQELAGDEEFLRTPMDAAPPPACTKCKSKNKKNLFFCNFCGEPFSENRPDILGSLLETGELNRVYEALSSGIGETVSMIALFRGFGKGLDTFLDSVKKVKHSEDTYPQLRKLIIAVPGYCFEFAKQLEEIESNINPEYHTLHPHTFAEHLKESLEQVLTEKNIETFFTEMGKELNRTTKEQWK